MDPYVKSVEINNKLLRGVRVNNFSKYDLTILCTDHYKFNYKKILNQSKKIIDTRGKFKIVNSKIIHL